jgi:hypothetical protein
MKAGLGTGVDIGADSQAESGQPPFVAPTLEEVARLFPQLEILGFIGQGGMGAVYKARQKALDRVVALKILPPGIGKDPAFAERFTREAKALARLNHPGIVTLYEFGQVQNAVGARLWSQTQPQHVASTEGAESVGSAAAGAPHTAAPLYFFLMELVDGMSLRHLLEVERISAREALAIVPQICDALQYAHDQGIVHRDIKPENILLDRQGRVKVADFGLAKLMGTDAGGIPLTPSLSPRGGEGAPALTDANKVMGTPQYMAPEQREHPTEVDHRADIYSLGVVFYQMLTGELPGKRIELPSQKVQVDVRLDEVVLRALEKDPERRYQQASQVKTDVENITTTPTEGAAGFSAAARPLSFQFGTWGWLETARWSARLLGMSLLAFFAVIFGLFLFGVGVPPLALQSGGTQLNYLAIALIVLGFVLGWKLEGTAAVLIATGWALWHSSNGTLAWSMFHIALLVAGLYAFCWWATHGRRTLLLVAAAGILIALLVCGIRFLPTNIYLYGAVLDAATGRPIPNAELTVSRLPFPPSTPESPAPARSSQAGWFALHVGWYTPEKQVRIAAPGYATLQMALGPKPLGTRRIHHDFALSRVPMTAEDDLIKQLDVKPK